MDLTSGIATRLTGLCLDDRGRLRDFPIWDVAARGALLVDLVRAGRLAQDDTSVTVDRTPTGFAPADRLVATMLVEPERSLDGWLDHGEVRMGDVAEACLASGLWGVRRRLLGRRFVDRTPVAAGDRELLRRPAEAADPDSAAVVLLALACGARRRPEPVTDDELSPTGPLRWICAAVTQHLEVAHRRNLRRAGAADGGFVPYH